MRADEGRSHPVRSIYIDPGCYVQGATHAKNWRRGGNQQLKTMRHTSVVQYGFADAQRMPLIGSYVYDINTDNVTTVMWITHCVVSCFEVNETRLFL